MYKAVTINSWRSKKKKYFVVRDCQACISDKRFRNDHRPFSQSFFYLDD